MKNHVSDGFCTWTSHFRTSATQDQSSSHHGVAFALRLVAHFSQWPQASVTPLGVGLAQTPLSVQFPDVKQMAKVHSAISPNKIPRPLVSHATTQRKQKSSKTVRDLPLHPKRLKNDPHTALDHSGTTQTIDAGPKKSFAIHAAPCVVSCLDQLTRSKHMCPPNLPTSPNSMHGPFLDHTFGYSDLLRLCPCTLYTPAYT